MGGAKTTEAFCEGWAARKRRRHSVKGGRHENDAFYAGQAGWRQKKKRILKGGRRQWRRWHAHQMAPQCIIGHSKARRAWQAKGHVTSHSARHSRAQLGLLQTSGQGRVCYKHKVWLGIERRTKARCMPMGTLQLHAGGACSGATPSLASAVAVAAAALKLCLGASTAVAA